jgi:hypothetical protein
MLGKLTQHCDRLPQIFSTPMLVPGNLIGQMIFPLQRS